MMVCDFLGPEPAALYLRRSRTGVYTPNPIAAAWPTAGDPVMIDVSMSITTHMLTGRLHKEGRKLPGKWVLDSDGNPSEDPAVLFKEPKGGLLPLGGTEYGHKGYALGLMVEALTGGLAGHGAHDANEGWRGECVRVSLRFRRSTAARRIRPSDRGWRTPAAPRRREPDSNACACPARPVCAAAENTQGRHRALPEHSAGASALEREVGCPRARGCR